MVASGGANAEAVGEEGVLCVRIAAGAAALAARWPAVHAIRYVRKERRADAEPEERRAEPVRRNCKSLSAKRGRGSRQTGSDFGHKKQRREEGESEYCCRNSGNIILAPQFEREAASHTIKSIVGPSIARYGVSYSAFLNGRNFIPCS